MVFKPFRRQGLFSLRAQLPKPTVLGSELNRWSSLDSLSAWRTPSRLLSLSSRQFIGIGMVLFSGFTLTLFGAVVIVMAGTVSILEEDAAQRSRQEVMGKLVQRTHTLQGLAVDYASHRSVKAVLQSPGQPSSSLEGFSPELLTFAQIDWIALIDPQGHVVLSRYQMTPLGSEQALEGASERPQIGPTPPALARHLQSQSPWGQWSKAIASRPWVCGLYRTPAGDFLISVAPVVEQQRLVGSVLVGRRLDPAFRLSNQRDYELSLYDPQGLSQWPMEVRQVWQQLTGTGQPTVWPWPTRIIAAFLPPLTAVRHGPSYSAIQTQPLEPRAWVLRRAQPNRQEIYQTILDIRGYPQVLRLRSPRPIYQQWLLSLGSFGSMVAILLGMVGLVGGRLMYQLWRYVQERDRMALLLRQEKELAQTTLDSLAEGVITTNAKGQVESLNPVAETLTGWSETAARGRWLGEVFWVVDETTRQPVELDVSGVLNLPIPSPNGFPAPTSALDRGEMGSITDPESPIQNRRPTKSLKPRKLLYSQTGQEYVIDESLNPIRDRQGEVRGAVLVFRDVTQPRQLERHLSWLATHDGLTGLLNRREFEQRLESLLYPTLTHLAQTQTQTQAQTQAQAQTVEHTLGFIDLDRFKVVNDNCGHLAGDRLLSQIAHLLQDQVRRGDLVARLGGDEFAILWFHCPLTQAVSLAQTLCQQIQAVRFVHGAQVYTVGASIGLAPVDPALGDMTDLMAIADAACYAAKRQGRGRVYASTLDDHVISRQREEVQWVARIQQALEKDEFCLYYQTIAPLKAHPGDRLGLSQDGPKAHDTDHYEVLLRLRDHDGSIISPAVFMPAAERFNLMPAIDRWVISTLFASQGHHYRRVWQRCQQHAPLPLYAINLSGSSINDEEFIHFVQDQLERHQIPPALICFEVTETVAIADLNRAAAFMQDLRRLGCKFALDDFGTGMSSLAYLKNLPLDYLKIDGCFVRDMLEDPVAYAMVEAISHLAQVMGIQTITEFVSSETLRQTVTALGVDYAQGYAIAHPKPLLGSPLPSEASQTLAQ